MGEIHRLALRAARVGVDEHELGKQRRLHQAEGDGGADVAAADDRGLSGILCMVHGALSPFCRHDAGLISDEAL